MDSPGNHVGEGRLNPTAATRTLRSRLATPRRLRQLESKHTDILLSSTKLSTSYAQGYPQEINRFYYWLSTGKVD
jgi:hypothetical protein